MRGINARAIMARCLGTLHTPMESASQLAGLDFMNHAGSMNEVASLIVPAAAALGGVALSQAWTAGHARIQFRRLTLQQSWQDRRSALLRYLVAINKAFDGTRKRTRELELLNEASPEFDMHLQDRTDTHDPETQSESYVIAPEDDLDQASNVYWAAAFEAFLELEIVLPRLAVGVAQSHIDDAYAWRRRCLRTRTVITAPSHAQLITHLAPWIGEQP